MNHRRVPLVLAAVACLVSTLTLIAAARAAPPADLQLVEIAGGLSSPLAVRHAGDGSGRLFIVERAGLIKIFDGNSGTVLPTPFLDIRALVKSSSGEQGLLGLDFHPDYETNGYFFVNYTRSNGAGNKDRTVVARYRVSANANIAAPGSALTLLEFEQEAANHNGGDIHFGPDGYLYIASGDGGGARDPNNRAQPLNTLLGKMLRIDVNGAPPPQPGDLCGLNPQAYGIPPDNPYAGGSGGCDEIWARGLRNPWRWSFDRSTGDMYIGDVGQGEFEEIDFQPAARGGRNYGWSCREGNKVQNFNPCAPGPLTPPILSYDHGLGCSITGGYRYRGSTIGGLQGVYIYGDFCSGRIWLATHTTAGWSSTLWLDTEIRISSFGEDESGELYVVDLAAGKVYRLLSPGSIFGDDFEGKQGF